MRVQFAIGLIALFLFVAGCVGDNVVCNKPYIRVGNTCCLDLNSNNICDEDEKNLNLTEESQSSPPSQSVTETQSEGSVFKECKAYDEETDTWLGSFILCRDKQDCYEYFQTLHQYHPDVEIPKLMECVETSFKKVEDENGEFISCNTKLECFEKIFGPEFYTEFSSEERSLLLEYLGIRCYNNFCEANEGSFVEGGIERIE